jgi:hypothetical protein
MVEGSKQKLKKILNIVSYKAREVLNGVSVARHVF